MKRSTPTALTAAALLSLSVAACGNQAPDTMAGGTPAATPGAVATDPDRDPAITTAVRAKFYTEALTRGRVIDVSAEDGVVTLSGTVPDEAARQRAVELARGIDGVARVDDRLTVAGASARAGETAPAPTGTSGIDALRSDPAWITTKLQAQYFLDPDIRPLAIDVSTATGGVVTLEGSVESAAEKEKAVRLARETEGVTRVEDRLRIAAATGTAQAAPSRPDPWITAKIQAKFFVDDEVKTRGIDVTTENGMVSLAGVVGSEAERRQAVALARNTEGVREVTDRLKVDAATAAGDRGASAAGTADRKAPPADGAAAAERGVMNVDRPDPWITMKIQAKYFLDSDVKGRQIDVDTREGVVTLTGTVDTAAQKQEAEQIARETEGVSRVVNRLAVGTAGR